MLGCASSGLRRPSPSVLDNINLNFSYTVTATEGHKDNVSWNDIFHTSQRSSEPVYRALSLCHGSARFGSDVDKVTATAVYAFEHTV